MVESDQAPRTRRRDALLITLPLAVLVLVAAFQFYQAFFHQLTPWKGGGFGMFSTIDSPGARFLRVRISDGTRWFSVRVPRDLRRLAKQVRSRPSDSQFAELCGRLAAGHWIYDPRMSDAAEYETLRRSETVREHFGPAAAPPAGKTPGGAIALSALGPADAGRVRWRKPGRKVAEDSVRDHVAVTSVRMELLNYRFESEAAKLTVTPLRAPLTCRPQSQGGPGS